MINIGIVGAGGMGTVHHSNYRHLDGCAVVGVVDPSPAGRERAAQWGVPCYESITDRWMPAAWTWWTSAPPPSSTETT